jgi:hypothetical protein
MKKYILSFTVITMLGMGYSLTHNQGNLYSSSTGAPGAGSCAVGGCHGGTALTSEHVTLTFLDANQNPVTTYTAGQTYTVLATAHAALTNAKFGFALSANGGTLSESSNNIQKVSNYLTHTAAGTAADAGGGKTWSASWTAPASGNVNFQLYLNASNNDNTSSGDIIYSRSAVLSQASGINDLVKEGSLSVYPVPAKDLVNIDFELKESSIVNITIVSHDGRLVKTVASEQLNSGMQHFELKEMASGLYFVTISANDQQITKKVLIQ